MIYINVIHRWFMYFMENIERFSVKVISVDERYKLFVMKRWNHWELFNVCMMKECEKRGVYTPNT